MKSEFKQACIAQVLIQSTCTVSTFVKIMFHAYCAEGEIQVFFVVELAVQCQNNDHVLIRPGCEAIFNLISLVNQIYIYKQSRTSSPKKHQVRILEITNSISSFEIC